VKDAVVAAVNRRATQRRLHIGTIVATKKEPSCARPAGTPVPK